MLFCRNISYPYGDSNTVVVVLYFDDIGNISYPYGDSNRIVPSLACHIITGNISYPYGDSN